MRLGFLGAAHTVTGSCYLLETKEKHYLIDCGMFQGARRVRDLNYEGFSFNPADIEGVLLTHAHVDHCGLIPKLVREGFQGSVYATKATRTGYKAKRRGFRHFVLLCDLRAVAVMAITYEIATTLQLIRLFL